MLCIGYSNFLHAAVQPTCQVHILRCGPQLGESLLGNLPSYGQKVENASTPIVDQNYCEWGRHLACSQIQTLFLLVQREMWVITAPYGAYPKQRPKAALKRLLITNETLQNRECGLKNEMVIANTIDSSLLLTVSWNDMPTLFRRKHIEKDCILVLSRLRPLMSCRKETSPISRVTGLLRPNAKPAAELMMPSIPLAPLFADTLAPRPLSTLAMIGVLLGS